MKRYRQHVMFAINIVFALISLVLLTLDMVQVEVALTRGELLPLGVAASKVGP